MLHFADKQVKTLEDLKGLKVRAPTRIGTKVLAALGAVPVQMPAPQVPEALVERRGRWRVVPLGGRARAQDPGDREDPHRDTSGAAVHVDTIFVVAMNQAKYDSLPPDLKKVIDANSGLAASKWAGQIWDAHHRAGAQAGAGPQEHDQRADDAGVRALEEGDRRRGK